MEGGLMPRKEDVDFGQFNEFALGAGEKARTALEGRIQVLKAQVVSMVHNHL